MAILFRRGWVFSLGGGGGGRGRDLEADVSRTSLEEGLSKPVKDLSYVSGKLWRYVISNPVCNLHCIATKFSDFHDWEHFNVSVSRSTTLTYPKRSLVDNVIQNSMSSCGTPQKINEFTRHRRCRTCIIRLVNYKYKTNDITDERIWTQRQTKICNKTTKGLSSIAFSFVHKRGFVSGHNAWVRSAVVWDLKSVLFSEKR